MHRAARGRQLVEQMMVWAFFGILAAIAVGAVMQWRERRTRRCLENLVAASRGRSDAPTCPASGLAYAVAEIDGRKTVACPDPKRHLANAPRFVQVGERWTFEQTVPAFELPADRDVELSDGSFAYGTYLRRAPDGVVVEERKAFWVRYVLGPLLALLAVAGLAGAIRLVFARGQHRASRAELTAIIILVLPLAGLAYLSSSDRTATIGGGRFAVQRRILGLAVGAPRVYERPIALGAVKAADRRIARVLYGKDGAIESFDLLTLRDEELGALGPIAAELFKPE